MSSLIFLQSQKTQKVLVAITSQTNESIQKVKHHDNEDAVCVPSEQNSSVRLYRPKNFVELEERIQSTTDFFDPSYQMLLRTSLVEFGEKNIRKAQQSKAFLQNQDD